MEDEESDSQKLLQILIKRYNLSIEDVQELSEEMTKKQILEKHIESFSPIWQGKNGRWYTYLPDETKKSGRKLIAKSTEEKLNTQIADYYKMASSRLEKITLEAFYPQWLKYKALHSNSDSYIHRIDNDWNRFYKETPIVNVPLRKLTKVMLDEWAHGLIKKHQMTKTQYYDMSIIMRQALILAVDKGILTKSPFDDVIINTKMFRSNKKKNDATQVFLIDEQVQIEQEALADFEKNGYPASIAVALCFQMGLRIGEMAVVKWSDIDELQENYMHIQRMEVKRHKHQTNGMWKCNGYEIVDHVKSDAGDRNVYLTKKAKEYLAMVRKWNEEHGFGDSEYIFLDKQGHNIHSRALDTRIRKYCRYIGISEKSMHKIRKTYISTLIDSQLVNLNTIRTLVGHGDERTTLKCYCFNRKNDLQTQESLEKALCF